MELDVFLKPYCQLYMRNTLYLFFLCACVSLQGLAQSSEDDSKKYHFEQLIQEFITTEAVYPQEKGEVQFTTSHYYNQLPASTQTTTSLLLEYGITHFLQIEAEMPYLYNDPNPGEIAQGLGDIEIGLLYNFLNKSRTSLAVVIEAGLPTGSQEKSLGNGEITWEPKLVLANRWGKLQTHLDLRMEFTSEETEVKYNLGTVFPLGAWKAVTELNGRYDITTEEGRPNKLFVTPAVIWNGAPGVEIALGVSIKLFDNPVTQLAFRLTYEFETLNND